MPSSTGGQAAARPPEGRHRGLPGRLPRRLVGPLQRPHIAARASSPLKPPLPLHPAPKACAWHADHRPQRVERPRGRLARFALGAVSGPSATGRAGSPVRGPGTGWAGQRPPGPCSPVTLAIAGPLGTHREGDCGRWCTRICAYRCICRFGVNKLYSHLAYRRTARKIARNRALLSPCVLCNTKSRTGKHCQGPPFDPRLVSQAISRHGPWCA